MTRTDIHSPLNIDPSQYEFLDDCYYGDSDDMHHEFQLSNRIVDTAVEEHGMINEWMAKCLHCSHHFAYGNAFIYKPTGQVAIFGHICAATTLSLDDNMEVRKRRARIAAEARMEDEAGNKRYATFTEQQPIMAAYIASQLHREFMTSMYRAIRKHGKLTEKQAAAIIAAPERDAQYLAEKQVRDAAKLLAIPVPEGTVTITGVIVSTKTEETMYGTSYKMLVEDDRHFRVYGSVPASINAERGARVKFTATCTRSEKDAAFGFYKRPRLAMLVSIA